MTTIAHAKSTTNPVISNAIAGAIMGLLAVTSAVSFGTVIFSGDLAPVLTFGIGLLLFSSVIISAFGTAMSSYPGMVVTIAEVTVPIFSLIARQVVTAMPDAPVEQKLMTVVATFALNSLITAAIFWALGWFKLGSFVRFIPYPVVGGFLAGIGALLLIAAFQSVSGLDLQPFTIAAFFQPNVFLQWFPGLIFAAVMFMLPQRITHFLIYPGIIASATALFYIVLSVTGISMAEATERGWLLGNIPSGGLYDFATLQAIQQADWSVVLQQIPTMAALWLISAIALLLHGNGIELVASRDLDLNRELKSSGIAWFLSGLGGGIGGFPSAGENTLAYQLGAKTRLAGWMVTLICLAMVVGGAPLLALFPKFILVGMPLLVTIEFFNEWLYEAWFKFSRSDYAIIVLIVLITVSVGFLQAIGAGLVAAIVLFVIHYSQLTVVRHASYGTYRHSNVLRTSEELEILEAEGQQAYIVELQGLIFFGTANKLLNQVRDRLNNSELTPLRYVILDFRMVSGLDSSAVLSFAKLRQVADQKQVHLLYSNLDPQAKQRLLRGECLEPNDPFCHLFPDLDRALEWYEQQILKHYQPYRPDPIPAPETALASHLQTHFSDPRQVNRLMACLELRQLAEHEYLFYQGDPFDGLYFVASGQVSVVLELNDGQFKRLRTYTVGNTIGEMGLYRQTDRMASVVADKPSSLYFLSAQTFEEIEASDPVLASNIHRFIVNLLAERLQHREEELKHLIESV
ncbi:MULTISPECIES: SulP family inorganic anion transporter [unclassified Leptolyngbya]|uniref:SulP family inorganic anion transporter n=1 Tax=unclassified Leptolyngbya TaxID=2650499 RepID=UPI0016825667|nr:SLC26A/SulP transporter family protein [Leptolyngbya sp. FACHB-8]MBD2157082.1 SLC26A/SulP transporter family protein [Leptolyngbya sp. FACHB-16]